LWKIPALALVITAVRVNLVVIDCICFSELLHTFCYLPTVEEREEKEKKEKKKKRKEKNG
jgi:hypothetical protein